MLVWKCYWPGNFGKVEIIEIYSESLEPAICCLKNSYDGKSRKTTKRPTAKEAYFLELTATL